MNKFFFKRKYPRRYLKAMRRNKDLSKSKNVANYKSNHIVTVVCNCIFLYNLKD